MPDQSVRNDNSLTFYAGLLILIVELIILGLLLTKTGEYRGAHLRAAKNLVALKGEYDSLKMVLSGRKAILTEKGIFYMRQENTKDSLLSKIDEGYMTLEEKRRENRLTNRDLFAVTQTLKSVKDTLGVKYIEFYESQDTSEIQNLRVISTNEISMLESSISEYKQKLDHLAKRNAGERLMGAKGIDENGSEVYTLSKTKAVRVMIYCKEKPCDNRIRIVVRDPDDIPIPSIEGKFGDNDQYPTNEFLLKTKGDDAVIIHFKKLTKTGQYKVYRLVRNVLLEDDRQPFYVYPN